MATLIPFLIEKQKLLARLDRILALETEVQGLFPGRDGQRLVHIIELQRQLIVAASNQTTLGTVQCDDTGHFIYDAANDCKIMATMLTAMVVGYRSDGGGTIMCNDCHIKAGVRAARDLPWTISPTQAKVDALVCGMCHRALA